MEKVALDLASTASATLTSIRNTLPSLVDRTPFYLDPQWWAIAIALLLGVAGFFQDNIRRLFQKPNLVPQITLSPPDCHKIALRDTNTRQFICDTYYLRFKVANLGNAPMEEVEVLAAELHKKAANGRFQKINDFLPINLHWAHNHVVTMKKIQPKLFKHCDFGHILETQTTFGNRITTFYGFTNSAKVMLQLDTFIEPNTGSHILFPGTYKIKIIFSANNVSPKEVWYRLVLKDVWDNNEDVMFRDNISVQKD